MVKRKALKGKKAGSIIDDPIDPPKNKNKAKNHKTKKQSRGK